jgi:hypothetical protein
LPFFPLDSDYFEVPLITERQSAMALHTYLYKMTDGNVDATLTCGQMMKVLGMRAFLAIMVSFSTYSKICMSTSSGFEMVCGHTVFVHFSILHSAI